MPASIEPFTTAGAPIGSAPEPREPRPKRLVLAGLSAGLGLVLAACDSGHGKLLHVYAAHHATPEAGLYPNRGGEDMARTFATDNGWEVTLTESFITIDAVTLVACSGERFPLTMFWGAFAEDLHSADLEASTIAGRKLPPGRYCAIQVEYAPFDMQAEFANGTLSRAEEAADGTTVYLRGGARQGEGDYVEFELRSSQVVRAVLDLSSIDDGRPLTVAPDLRFPKELTIAKAYDRFFDGVDFDALDPVAIEDRIPSTLIEQTWAFVGTQVSVSSD